MSTFREQVIDAAKNARGQLNAIYASWGGKHPSPFGVQDLKTARRAEELEAEYRRLVAWLMDNGGAPLDVLDRSMPNSNHITGVQP